MLRRKWIGRGGMLAVALVTVGTVYWIAQYTAMISLAGTGGSLVDSKALAEELHPKVNHGPTASGADLGGDAFDTWGTPCTGSIPFPSATATPSVAVEIPDYTLATLARGEGELVVMAPPGRRVVGDIRGPALVPLVFAETSSSHGGGGGIDRTLKRFPVPYTSRFTVPIAGRYTLTVTSPGPSTLACHCPERPVPRAVSREVRVPYVHGSHLGGAHRPTRGCAGEGDAHAIGDGFMQRSPCAQVGSFVEDVPEVADDDDQQRRQVDSRVEKDNDGAKKAVSAPAASSALWPGGFEHVCGTHLHDEWAWHVHRCVFRVFDTARTRRCLAGRSIAAVGDSTSERTAIDIVRLLLGTDGGVPLAPSDGTTSHSWNVAGAKVSFVPMWDYPSSTSSSSSSSTSSSSSPDAIRELSTLHDAVLVNIGMDYVARGDKIHSYPADIIAFAHALREAFPPRRRRWNSPAQQQQRRQQQQPGENPNGQKENARGEKASRGPIVVWRTTFAAEAESQARSCATGPRVAFVNRVASRVLPELGFPVLDTGVLSAARPECSDGMHRDTCATSMTVTQAWLNVICPSDDDDQGMV